MQLDHLNRRDFIALLGAGSAGWPLVANAQESGKVYRIGYLAFLRGQDSETVLQRLSELGYSEGRNVRFDYRSADGQAERLPQLAAELVRTGPDVLVAGFGTLTAQAAKAATATIPVVFTSVGDPIGAGVVASLNRPGGNVTGVSSEASDVVGKRLQILQECIPGKLTVAVLVNPDTPFSALALQELRTAADAKGLRVEVFEARTADQVPVAIEAASQAGAAGLITLEDPLIVGVRRQIAELVAKARLPAVYANRAFVEAGGLMSYGVDRRQLYRHAAAYVDKILRGAKPADLPVEQPTQFEFVINLKAAQSLGFTVPNTLLVSADQVIE
jgi:putative tryptophan/tyrosine transport system substrate-binding protein